MTTVAGTLTDYGNTHDFRSVLENKLNAKKSELGETELNLKKFIGNRIGNTNRGGVEGRSERLSSFKGRLGPVVLAPGERASKPTNDRRASIGARLGPRVSESIDEDDTSNTKDGSNGFGGEVTGRGSVMSRIVVEQKSREDALAEKKVDKKETQRNKRMFGSILGTLQKFRADENKDKDRELKKRKIEAKIDQKTEKEKEEAVRQKKELFDDKKIKEREIKVLQVQMKRAEEFETWERSKRKEQKYIRTKNSSTKIYYLPKHHNEATLTALENTMDEIDQEIQAARELFEEELLKISNRADQNPNASLDDLEGDDNSGDENDTDKAVTKSIVSAIKKPHENKTIDEETKSQGAKENHTSPINTEVFEMSNGLAKHIKVSQNGNSNPSEDFCIKNEKSNNEKITGHEVELQMSSETSVENHVSVKEKIVGNMVIETNETNVASKASEIKENHEIPSVTIKLKEDERENTNILSSPIRNITIIEDKHEKKIGLLQKTSRSKERKSRSKSPKAEKGMLKRSSSSGERQTKLNKLRNESNDRLSTRKRRNSNVKTEASKKSKTKKRKASSDESSSTSSSNEQSETDGKSAGTNSSSDNSDSSDDSSSDNDKKKIRKKKSKSKTKVKKATDNINKQKESSNVEKRRNKKSRTNTSKKYSDSSD